MTDEELAKKERVILRIMLENIPIRCRYQENEICRRVRYDSGVKYVWCGGDINNCQLTEEEIKGKQF